MWVCFWLLVNAYACICMSAFGGQRLASVGVSYGTWEFTSLIRMMINAFPRSAHLSLPPPRIGSGDWWPTCGSPFSRGSHFIDWSIDPAPQRGSEAWIFLFASFFILLSWDMGNTVLSPMRVLRKWGSSDGESCTSLMAGGTLEDTVRSKHLSWLTSHFCICSCRRIE